MNCKQIRSCFYDYTDDIVDQTTRSAIESHLSSCAPCRRHYQTQQRLHQSVASAVDSELAGMHFKPAPIQAEPIGAEHHPLLGVWGRRMAFAVPCLLIFCIALWILMNPSSRLMDDAFQSAYAEAFHYLETHSVDRSGTSDSTMPVAVIMQPGAPTRGIVLDGTTDLSAELE